MTNNRINLKGFPSDKEIAKAESEGKPLILAPSVKANCNYKCIMCFVRSGKVLSGEIELEEHKFVIDQISKMGAKYTIIAMVGEPFMDPAFYNPAKETFPLIDYANKHGMYVVAFTNGSLVRPEILKKLIRKDVSLIGKLWSFNPGLYNEMTGAKNEFVEYKGLLIPKGIKLMMDAGFNKIKNEKTRMGIDIIVTSKNYREIPDIVNFALKNGIKPVIDTMIPTERARQNYDKLKLGERQNKWLYLQLVKSLGKGFVNDQFVEGCAVRRVGLAYDNFGEVRVCCALEANVGNIKYESIKQLFEKIQAYRKQLPHYKKVEKTLGACDTAMYVKEKEGLLKHTRKE